MSILLKLMYRFNTIPVNILTDVLIQETQQIRFLIKLFFLFLDSYRFLYNCKKECRLRVRFTQPPPMVTSYKTLVQNQNRILTLAKERHREFHHDKDPSRHLFINTHSLLLYS